MYKNPYIEDLPYEGLIGHSLRIGDTLFYVPPTSIKVQHQMQNERVQLMRARHSVVKNGGYFKKMITITLYFPNRDSINNELRPLLAQAQKCPFLPIENDLINNNHGVEAISVMSVNTQTLPGFPNCLVATIQGMSFDPSIYIYDGTTRSYAEMFNWPLFRWYYKRSLMKTNRATFYEPLYSEMDNQFSFNIINEEQLAKLKELKRQRKEIIHDYLRAKEEKFWGQKKAQKEFFEEMDKSLSEMEAAVTTAEKEMYQYDTIDTSGLILTNFSAMAQHNLTEFQIQMNESPGQQYLGSQETMYIVEFETTDIEMISVLTSMNSQATQIARDYNTLVPGAILEFDSQLTRLFGSTYITIEDMSFSTSADHRGIHKISITMLGANRVGKKAEEVKWISKNAEWDIDAYDGATLLSSVTPEIIAPDFQNMNGDEVSSYFSIFKAIPFSQTPIARTTLKWFKNIGRNLKADEKTDKRATYEAEVMESMKALELYPDLELPKYEEVAAAGFSVPNTNDGQFVDPDFFLMYQKLTSEESLEFLTGKESEVEYRDNTGGLGTGSPGKLPANMNPITKKQMDEATKSSEEESSEEKNVESQHDEKNVTKEQAEALIRKKAYQFNLNQDLAVALSQTMDPKMRQFYDVGVNKELNHRKVTKDGVPVSLNSNLVVDGSEKKGSTRYYGMMKVPSKVENGEYIAYNIQDNVQSGVELLDEKLKKAKMMYRSAKEKGYNVENVKKAFGITDQKGSSDEQLAIFAGAFMMYFGMTKEFTDLMKGSGTPDKATVKLVKNFLNIYNGEKLKKDPTYNQIEKDLKDVKLKDMRSTDEDEDVNTPYSGSTTDIKGDDLDADLDKALFLDATMYDKRGRLIQAYPTFLLNFIDEGKFVGSVKLADQFFHYQPVKDIMYVNSRKNASSTLYLEMSNVYGSLSDSEAGLDVSTTTYREMIQMLTLPGVVAQNAERTRNRWQSYQKNIFLSTGVRVHFRMGYSSNPLGLPTIMNGTITSIQNGEESLSVVVQDDGYELANKMRVQADDETGGLIFAKKEPTEIIDEILSDSNGFFKNIKTLLSNKEYEYHSLGIMHFGSPGLPQGISQFKSFITGGLGGTAAGAGVGAGVGAVFGGVGAIPGSIIGASLGGLVGSFSYAKTGRSNSEIMQNIYSTNGKSQEDNDKWWNNVQNALGLDMNGYDEDNISINLFDKSIWDIITICSYLGPDFIVAVHPFDFRNTIFMGRPYSPLKYGYEVKDGKAVGTMMKPFKQFHSFDSYTSIIGNSIKATEDNMRTVAIGTYMDNGNIGTTQPVYADINIWPEKQRVVNVDTTMNAKGIRIVEAIPLVGSFLNKPFKWKFDKGVALRITAAELREYMKDMYDGYLTVLGYPAIKPFDGFYLTDTMNDMSGQLDVKEVTQIMNYDVGFITMIKPDLVVVNRDAKTLTLTTLAAQFAAKQVAVHIVNIMLRKAGFKGDSPIVSALWALGKNTLRKQKEIYQKTKSRIKPYKDALTGEVTSADEIREINETRSGRKGIKKVLNKANLSGKLKKILAVIGEKTRLKDIMNSTKGATNKIKDKKMAKKLTKILKAGKASINGIKDSVKVAVLIGSLSNPVGIVAKVIEYFAVEMTLNTVGEMINRRAMTSQAVLMAPITRGGVEFSAGINGHKGSVVGDSPSFWRGIFASPWMSPLAALLRYDQDLLKPAGETTSYNKEVVQKSYALSANGYKNNSQSNIINNFITKSRKTVIVDSDDSQYQKIVKNDAKAFKGANNISTERTLTKADYSKQEESPKWKEIVGKFKDWIVDAFNWMKNTIKKYVDMLFDEKTKKGNETDPRDCAVSNIKIGGKATNLSKGMKHIGPIIERECKAGGIPKWTELMKAMCMIESSGDYIKTPDCMQSSESAGHGRNYFKTPEQSIKQAVVAIKDAIRMGQKQCDEKAVIQAYNYGGQFAKYALTHNSGKWSFKTAKDFACKMRPGTCHYGNSEYIFRLAKYYKMPGGNGNCDEAKKDNPTTNEPVIIDDTKKSKNVSVPNLMKVLDSSEVNVNKDISNRKESDYQYDYNLYAQMQLKESLQENTTDGDDIQMLPETFKTSKDDAMHKVKEKDLLILNNENIQFDFKGRFAKSTKRLHRGSLVSMKIAANSYKARTGKQLTLASCFLPNDPSWLGTGWGVEVSMPDGLESISGKTRYPKGKAKEDAKEILEVLIKAGFSGISIGDYDIAQEFKVKYPEADIQYLNRRKTLRCNYIKE